MRRSATPPILAVLACAFCLLALSAGLRAEKPVEQRFQAADGVRLRADWWRGATPAARLILVLPGFAQNKATGTMRFVAGLLTPTADVLVLDLRGTGESDGEYSFGAEEARDAQAALAWAKSRYADVTLMGFSLGSYIGLRACVEGPLRPQRGLLVSLPVRFEGVISSGGLWTFLTKGFWAQRKDPMAVPEDADTTFRWGPLLLPKPRATDLAARAALPLHFLVGAKDQLVFPWTTRLSYDAVPGTATWTLWPDGRHAEAMALKHPEDFTRWVRACMDFHGTGKRENPFGLPR